jgi:hypothetical protein
VSFKVHREVRHAHQAIRERLEVRRRPSAKALEPGAFASAARPPLWHPENPAQSREWSETPRDQHSCCKR